ncbi:copper homeostasis protein CutC [Vibrio splendidus]|uniref:Copper homeostasis protein cutC homolog n=1 Tax=Vibrio splendidus 12E03 TaxID=1191305 RepID=A0A1E5FSI7_VIBSP|nr:copper homeostasis protein CutC [Vibrio splendidus]OEF93486.1 copper homeostasis protein CutC [Vibrio splendidus 12E03]
MIKEICVENFTSIPDAIRNGANRISLKDNYRGQGTTVSKGVMKQAIAYAHFHNVTVCCCIRPRVGNFVYTREEIEIMLTDISTAIEMGTDAVDFGCLNDDNTLDKDAMLTLLEAAKGITAVFHMAFDEIPRDEHKNTLDWLANNGISAVLTHGGKITDPIDLDYIKETIEMSNGRMTIIPGGGINYMNAEPIAKTLEISEIHGSQIVKLDSYEF